MNETGILTVSKPLALTSSNNDLFTVGLFQSVSPTVPFFVESRAFPKFHALPIIEVSCEAVLLFISVISAERLS